MTIFGVKRQTSRKAFLDFEATYEQQSGERFRLRVYDIRIASKETARAVKTSPAVPSIIGAIISVAKANLHLPIIFLSPTSSGHCSDDNLIGEWNYTQASPAPVPPGCGPNPAKAVTR